MEWMVGPVLPQKDSMVHAPCAKVALVQGAVHAGAITSATPFRCSTSDLSATNMGKVLLPATTTSGTGNDMLQGVVETTVDTHKGCSAYVLPSPLQGSTTCAWVVNAAPLHRTSFPCFDGWNPCLWRAQCLEYFNRFNINKCMWVIASTMHMEGKAKVWYEAYRLRQAVGDWSEFMDNVESHFGVADLPPLVPIMGVTHPSYPVHASEDISPKPPNSCLPVSSKEVMVTAANPTELTLVQCVESIQLQIAQLKLALDSEYEERKMSHLQSVNQMPEPMTEGADDVFTCVGGSSLFLELDMDYNDEVLTCIGGMSLFLMHCVDSLQTFSEIHLMEFDDEIFTCVGDCSIFLESDMDDPVLVLAAPFFQDVVCAMEIADNALSHVDGSSFFLDMPLYSRIDILDANLPCKCSDFSSWNSTVEYEMLSWCQNGFSLGNPRWPLRRILKLIDNYGVPMQLASSSAHISGWIAPNWDPLRSSQFLTANSFLRLEEFKGSGAHANTYIQLDLQNIPLFSWSSHFCIYWSATWALLCMPLYAFGQLTCFSSSPRWYIWRLECTQQQTLYCQILQLITSSSALSKVEFLCLLALENQAIILVDIQILELLAASVLFHVLFIQKLNTIVTRLPESQQWHPNCKKNFSALGCYSDGWFAQISLIRIVIELLSVDFYGSMKLTDLLEMIQPEKIVWYPSLCQSKHYVVQHWSLVSISRHSGVSTWCPFQSQDHCRGQEYNQKHSVSRIAFLIVPWDPGGTDTDGIPSIAWGQAMFLGGGNVITAHGNIWGRGVMGRGPSRHGLVALVMVYKASRNNTVEDGTEKYRTSLVFFFVGSSPLNLLLLQVRLLSTSIQGPVATTSDQCINLTSRRSAMATGHDTEAAQQFSHYADHLGCLRKAAACADYLESSPASARSIHRRTRHLPLGALLREGHARDDNDR